MLKFFIVETLSSGFSLNIELCVSRKFQSHDGVLFGIQMCVAISLF